MQEYIKWLSENALINEAELRPLRQREIMWAELKPIRDEICNCLMFGFALASISLTNHFLERVMKLGLIYFHAENPSLDSLEKYNMALSAAVKQWDKENLYPNIQKAVKLGILSKELSAELLDNYDEVRNGFSHAQMSKLFQNGKVRLASFSFSNPEKPIEIQETPLSNVLIMHGNAVIDWAKEIAAPYFMLVLEVLADLEQNIKRLFPR